MVLTMTQPHACIGGGQVLPALGAAVTDPRVRSFGEETPGALPIDRLNARGSFHIQSRRKEQPCLDLHARPFGMATFLRNIAGNTLPFL